MKMLHHVKQNYEELKVENYIILDRPEGQIRYLQIMQIHGDLTLTCRYTNHLGNYEYVRINYSEYLYTDMTSPDLPKEVNDQEQEYWWTRCEQHYGINHLGSQDPDPIRQFAFAILKGDPVACDAVRDILKI